LAKKTIKQALDEAVGSYKAGNIEAAKRLLSRIIQIEPNQPDANHNMGRLLIESGDLEEALHFLKTALEANFSEAQYWFSNIDALFRLNRFSEAAELLEIAKDKGCKGPAFDDLGEKLNSPAVKKEIEIKTIRGIIKDKPDFETAYLGLGNALKEQGKLEEAVEAYKKALAVKPDYADAYYNIGVTVQEQGKLEEAIEAYNKVLAIQPDYDDAYYNMGNVLKKQGKLEEAIEAYTKELTTNPDYAVAYYNIGIVRDDQGKLEEAIEAYTKALAIKPDYADAYLNASELLKTYAPKSQKTDILLSTNERVKKVGNKLLSTNSDKEIADNLSEAIDCISKDKFNFKTPLSQIYRRNSVDLNCRRHSKIFYTKNIIPEFCFGCFKVQIEVDTLFSLIKLTTLFYELELEDDLTRKTIIELRPNIAGFYKGLIYCRGLDQAQRVKKLLDINLKNTFHEETLSHIKRGCSEFPLKFPEYGKISSDPAGAMDYPSAWKPTEDQFDQTDFIKPLENITPSISGFCLSDFYIIQKWIDYAKGLEDPSSAVFNDKPIIYPEIYDNAVRRKANLSKLLE
jgi:tetratricopeptide (TPR) repeat protein